jgi:pimeloyl-ACP methyl ester carboxylesterase
LNVLAVDLRRHGESGGRFSTSGCLERADISRVIDKLKAERPEQTRRVILFGISTGAAVAAAVAADRTDIAAVVLESPFTDYKSTIARHAKLSGMPGGPVLTAAVGLAQLIARVNFDTARPTRTIPKIRCPVLAIVGAEDGLLSDADREELWKVIGGEPNQFWLVPNAPHLLAMHTEPAEYARRVEAFLTGGQI